MGSKSIRPGVLRIVGSSETHNAASAWNQVFSRQGPCLVRVTLTDGRIVGGFFDERLHSGSISSLDLYDVEDSDILEREIPKIRS